MRLAPLHRLRYERGPEFDRRPSNDFDALDLLYGVLAPIGCFWLFIAAVGDVIQWPLTIFVAWGVLAFVASLARSPVGDAFDAVVHGSLGAATFVALPWAGAIRVPCAGSSVILLIAAPPAAVVVGVIGTAPIGSCYVYYRRCKRRFASADPSRRWRTARLVGGLAPGVVCAALLTGLVVRSGELDDLLAQSPTAIDVRELEVWRTLAPRRDWPRIEERYWLAPDSDVGRDLDAAHFALTGRSLAAAPDWD